MAEMMAMVMIPLMIAGGFDGVETWRAHSASLRLRVSQDCPLVITVKATSMIKSRMTYSGVTSAARRFGCSREHLSKVLHGQRKPNDKLRRRLARLGVTTTVDGKEFKEGK